jgi:mannosyltransferase
MEGNLHILNKEKRKEVSILILCLFIGFALRFYTFDQKSLWMDEIYTFNDSRDDFRGQLKFYGENPTFLHPPLFFILTHLFSPFPRPERDLRIIPLIFGTLSIPMIYFLSRSFSSAVALPCTLSLTFMAYHISLSQDARSYSLLMFLGMMGLYFFMKHLKTSKKLYLVFVALFFAMLFHTSYSSIPFIALSQILWFYQTDENRKHPSISSIFILNGLIIFICIPWVTFLAFNYKGQPVSDLRNLQDPFSFWSMMYGIFHDWMPYAPLMISSIILFILFPIFTKNRKNALVLLSLFICPIGGLYLYCRLFNITHFVTSRYFISFLPLFFITIFLSLHTIEAKFEIFKNFIRLKFLFVILLIVSNLLILSLYYRSEKQDYRGLVTYLKGQLQNGDKIIVGNPLYISVMLHYFGVYPEGRHYVIPAWKVSDKEFEHKVTLIYQDIKFSIAYSQSYWFKYFSDGSRLWIAADKTNAKMIMEKVPCVLKGYFDGSFLNFNKFPTDASIYLLLWDPGSPNEKGITMPIE